MENLENRIDVKGLLGPKGLSQVNIKTKLHVNKTFDNDLVAIRKSKVILMLNKPAYDGMSIVDLSKLLMYEFHYGYTKNKNDNNYRLLFTDTDSLMYEIKWEDVHEDFNEHKETFHFSIYWPKSKDHNDSNK